MRRKVNQLSRKAVKPRKKKRRGLFSIMTTGAIIAMIIFCVASIISSKATVLEKNKELQSIRQQTEELEAENIEYQRIIDNDDINTYIEKYATENPEFNYGIPRERRFYDISRN